MKSLKLVLLFVVLCVNSTTFAGEFESDIANIDDVNNHTIIQFGKNKDDLKVDLILNKIPKCMNIINIVSADDVELKIYGSGFLHYYVKTTNKKSYQVSIINDTNQQYTVKLSVSINNVKKGGSSLRIYSE